MSKRILCRSENGRILFHQLASFGIGIFSVAAGDFYLAHDKLDFQDGGRGLEGLGNLKRGLVVYDESFLGGLYFHAFGKGEHCCVFESFRVHNIATVLCVYSSM